jgi:periplasmic protein TonB
MFEDSLVETRRKLAGRRRWTTVASFAAQLLLSGFLVLLSLIYSEALPTQKLMSVLEAPSPPQAAAPASRTVVRSGKQASEFDHSVLTIPREVPKIVAVLREDELPSGDFPGVETGVPNGVPDTVPNTAITNLLHNTPVAVPKISVEKVRVSSGVAQGLLIREVTPHYPPLARLARIQGTVVLQAIIGKDGTVENLRVVSGHPMLANAAIDAVKQWLYRPYSLNGAPVEVDTQINVNFTLAAE